MCETEHSKEPFQPSVLEAGDIVRYYEYPGIAGDTSWLRTDTITAVVLDEYPLRFLHGCPYHPDGLMKNVFAGYSTPPPSEVGSVSSVDTDDDKSRGTDIKLCVLSQYNLVYGGKGQACACVMKDSATIKEFGEHVTEKNHY